MLTLPKLSDVAAGVSVPVLLEVELVDPEPLVVAVDLAVLAMPPPQPASRAVNSNTVVNRCS